MPFQKLLIWQKGMDLVKLVYVVTKSFPKEEIYGLTSQSRRSAISIPSNIAEGSQRTSEKEFANFILMAKGSLAELHTQMLAAHDLGFISQEQIKLVLEKIIELDRMLYAFYKKLTNKT
ncbi:four helix bundle protein [Candidatus Peribacteria bacterium RIFCSPHIGHO2_02_FULL_52_16]|nr:MAG: four helix bundle protein [Candidatus Peribacteria bacterium RIFCSPHIGHO2_01_FULL_51_35]OGJ61983.1 MAG: four helix bundle protein [Candidatus Peribacteria bacterium RIFCSPHIGHO2_02_FULL_52_16]